MKKFFYLFFLVTVSILIISCDRYRRDQVETIMSFDIDSLDEVITKDGVEIDSEISSDGNGSLKITADGPISVKLFQTGDIDVEDSVLIYSAKLRTENLDGQAYIEMWCGFPEKGLYFSKALNSALTGTNDWKIQETPFFLKKGTVWIDQIELFKRPLN